MISTRAAIVAAGFALSVALTACDGSSDEPTVATAATGQPAASGTPVSGSVAAYVEAQRKWVACMREQGFDLPDPDAKGRVELSGDDNRRFKADPKFLAAHETCKEFNVEVPAELEPKREPLTAQQIARLRDYSKCMRESGMPDYPDPDANGEIPEGWGGELTPQEGAANIRALQICSPILDGRPKGTPNPAESAQG